MPKEPKTPKESKNLTVPSIQATPNSDKKVKNQKHATSSADNNNNAILEKKTKNMDIVFLIVEKNGDIKETVIKEGAICADELAKKCKFKKADGYIKRTEWGYSFKTGMGGSSKIVVEMWGKDDGMPNHENKYEFPPPLDHDLYFGACALIARDYKNRYTDLTEDMWDDIYEYLFGGFESLATNEDDDEDEYDELDSIPMNRKTRDGYLKDGFVVDSRGGGSVGRIGVAGGDEDGIDMDDEGDEETDELSESDSEEDNSEDGDAVSEGGGGIDCFNNIGISTKNVSVEKIKTKSTSALLGSGARGSNKISSNKNNSSHGNGKYKDKDKDEECDNNSGWKTDESSELSEEEYSYSK
jgi:hypothetical protein